MNPSEKSPESNIGRKIKELRESKKLSQRQLAKDSGVPQATINRIESGEIKEPSLSNVTKIADALGVTVTELQGNDISTAIARNTKAGSTPADMKYPAIALIEFGSIAAGITAGDAMVKKAPIVMLKAGTVHPGKYLVFIGGDVASVEESYHEGMRIRPETIVDDVLLPDVHKQVHDAILGNRITERFDSIGIIETSTVASNIDAADAGVKGADVIILEIRLADDLGGKSFTIFGGKVEDVEAAVEIGKERIKDKDIVIHTTVIPRIDDWMAEEIDRGTRFYES
ncbi:MAG: BMC domain-containing protein [candidate division Zixibacteria bacterium]|nr:BMC domain-containing protein [candidate division Zixibacteria bacterium]